MSEVRALIQQLVDAGVDPIDAAEVITRAAILGAANCGKDEQAERRRAADRERKREKRLRNSAESADTLLPPSLDKEAPPTPPEEIKLSPLTPQTTQQGGRDASNLDRLSERLCDAADGKMHPQSAVVVGPILEMMAQGVDLETDILPAIRSRAAKLDRAVDLRYFLGSIRDAYNRRIEAGRGLSKPKPSTVKRPEDMTEGERRDRLAKFLSMARSSGIWLTWMLGPPPGQEGCNVPADLLEPRDTRIDWIEEKQPRAA
jgi:hypothetical protein